MTTIERAEYDEHVRDQVTTEEGGVVEKDGRVLTYEEWMVGETGAAPITIDQIAVVDFDPGSGLASEYSSQTWKVRIKDQEFRYEQWFTHNSGGTEWYDAEGNSVGEDPGEIIVLGAPIAYGDKEHEASVDDIIGDLADKAANAFLARYEELVQPVVKQIKEEIFPLSVITE